MSNDLNYPWPLVQVDTNKMDIERLILVTVPKQLSNLECNCENNEQDANNFRSLHRSSSLHTHGSILASQLGSQIFIIILAGITLTCLHCYFKYYYRKNRPYRRTIPVELNQLDDYDDDNHDFISIIDD